MRLSHLLLAGVATLGGTAAHAATLVGFASLPAETFIAGPTSGQFGISGNGISGPFIGQQPVQGFSSIIANGQGGYTLLSDNGFGTQANSADALLLVHDVSIDFRTASGGTGTVTRNSSTALSDPNRQVNFEIQADKQFYYDGTIPVDVAIQSGRLLTGADFDTESFRRAPDGSYYFGDEFGPFIVHTDANFRVIAPPVALPGVQSPQNPFLNGAPNLPASGGFEGMAISPDGTTLYAMLERPVTGDPANTLRINTFDIASNAFTGDTRYYRLSPGGTNIGELTAIGDDRFIVIERDGGSGDSAQFKKIFLVDFNIVDAEGNLIKQEILDLLNVADPDDLNGDGSDLFIFPFVTIESVLALDPQTLLIVNDNNFPGGGGRGAGIPDNNEFILVRLDAPLAPVPEPASWAMMIAGFGLVGGALRTRRQAAAIA